MSAAKILMTLGWTVIYLSGGTFDWGEGQWAKSQCEQAERNNHGATCVYR